MNTSFYVVVIAILVGWTTFYFLHAVSARESAYSAFPRVPVVNAEPESCNAATQGVLVAPARQPDTVCYCTGRSWVVMNSGGTACSW